MIVPVNPDDNNDDNQSIASSENTTIDTDNFDDDGDSWDEPEVETIKLTPQQISQLVSCYAPFINGLVRRFPPVVIKAPPPTTFLPKNYKSNMSNTSLSTISPSMQSTLPSNVQALQTFVKEFHSNSI